MEKFIGPGIKNIKDGDLDTFKEERILSGKEKHQAEMEKTQEEEKMLTQLVGFLNTEMESLGLPIFNFPLERLHLLPKHFYWQPGGYTVGSYNPEKHSIQTEVSRLRLDDSDKIKDKIHKLIHLAPISFSSEKDKDASILLHELIHASSFVGFFVKEDGDIKNYRSGYDYGGVKKELTKNGDYFRGLNEAITQKITEELFSKNMEKIFKSKEIINAEKKILGSPTYKGYIDILNTIIKTISQFEYKTEGEIWKRIEKGYFTGEMMHLRKIEEIFGPGSLRVLAAMNPTTMSNLVLEDGSLFMKYFSFDINKEEKEKIADEILTDEENIIRNSHINIIQNSEKRRDKYL